MCNSFQVCTIQLKFIDFKMSVDRCEDMEFFCALNRLQLLHNATVTVVMATADCEREEEFEVWLDACRANLVSSRDFIDSYISPVWQGNVSLLGLKVSL